MYDMFRRFSVGPILMYNWIIRKLDYYLRKTIQRTGRKNGKVYQGFDFTALS